MLPRSIVPLVVTGMRASKQTVLRILIVDDQPFQRQLMSDALRTMRHVHEVDIRQAVTQQLGVMVTKKQRQAGRPA